MDAHLQKIFVGEIERQCRFAHIAAIELREAIARQDTDRVWFAVQSLLIAAGNVSKLLWPKRKYSTRGQTLRRVLAVEESSPLRSRTFRNHFEHFDERLESWATSSSHRGLADSNINIQGRIRGADPGDYLRNLEASSSSVTFCGDTYELAPVMQAIQRLHETACAFLR